MNKIHILKNVKFISRIFYPRYHVSCSIGKQHVVYHRWKVDTSSYLKLFSSSRCISNYSSVQKKDSDTLNDKSDSEKIQKIMEDEEFQSILKDFANDFGVDKETSNLLDDIRKNINGDYNESKISSVKSDTNAVLSSSSLGRGLDHKYKEFSDADSTVIPSYEDTFKDDEQIFHIDQELKPKYLSILKRGITGVFDIEDMIQVLHNESLLDIAVISMLTDDNHCSCDFFVLVTAKSLRHCEAVAESIIKLYKKIKNLSDPFITVEGANNSGWKVIDMGNIVLHIFLEEVRIKYDIESCQLFDLQYDGGGNIEPDPMLKIIEEQMEFFNSLQQSKPEVSKDIS